jgi:adenine-specific DNA-methyltransferase
MNDMASRSATPELNVNSSQDDPLERLKDLLRTLFQFDMPELDFGIYRIMNYRRREIEEFIEKHLIQAVEKEFQEYRKASVKELEEKVEEAKKKVMLDLGEDALRNGDVREDVKSFPVAKKYLELKKQLEDAQATESIKNQVFNDLYNFFSRYYEDGDFISKRRYSFKQERYAIPYNGEEVKFYWATADQYYVKTDELFKDYEFTAKGWRIVFRAVVPEPSAGNTKEERRYFVLAGERPVELDSEQKVCVIRFEYRQLTEEDLDAYGLASSGARRTVKQDELNAAVRDKLLKEIRDQQLASILTEKEGEKTLLDKHILRFTRKNTTDFFIHKNLKGFLERELDYFIKTEVLDLNNLDARHIARAKVIEAIGKRIIEFLAQIEDFQKMLWEKKKFVLRTDYVITLGKIEQYAGGSFLQRTLPEVCSSKEQLAEWSGLFGVKVRSLSDLTKLDNWKNLPIDTRYFPESFKDRLLEALSKDHDLDEIIDGVLVKSENWQALNLLAEKYREKVQTIYIDPPFNKEQEADYLYSVKYKDATWITMLENRIQLAKELLCDSGNIFVRCDYNGNFYVRMLMNEIFGIDNFRNEIILRKTAYLAKREVNNLEQETESLMNYCKNREKVLFKRIWLERKPQWVPMQEKPNRGKTGKPIIIEGKIFMPREGYCWARGNEVANRMYKEGRLRIQDGKLYILLDKKAPGTNWTDIVGYATDWRFTTENSEILLKRVIESTSNEGDLVMDFFLGIGTTTAVAHKLKRKWIGIEMGKHFHRYDTDKGPSGVLVRMKEVLAGRGKHEPCGISREVNWQGGGFFKYQYLEQYEDSLHNIDLVNEEKGKKALEAFRDTEKEYEYLMRYFLRYETDGSPSLLNIEYFRNPFEYKLKIISNGKGEEVVTVDLVETFNYLIGLHVSKYRFINDNGRRYVFVFGRRGGRKIAVVWRSTNNINLEKDKEVIVNAIKDYSPDELYINGDALIDSYRVIESEFKALMGV